ncbi:hypothetical protein DFH28DRAFT_1124230 [Melampsora americana]|nr:hypothetical protein DFH28DRAFT_1124230 [Melampsora americana]
MSSVYHFNPLHQLAITSISSLPITTIPISLKSKLSNQFNLINVIPILEPKNWNSIDYLICFKSTSIHQLPTHSTLISTFSDFNHLLSSNLKFTNPTKSTLTPHSLNSIHPILHSSHPFSGKAVLLDGIPFKLSSHHIIQSLSHFGHSIIHPQPVHPIPWPALIIPFQPKLPLITRHQIIYCHSNALAHHLAGQLHRSRPTWLPSRQDPSGWELKARVIY